MNLEGVFAENPVHQNDEDKWCFWDEVWAFEIGSYDTEEEATQALVDYCKAL